MLASSLLKGAVLGATLTVASACQAPCTARGNVRGYARALEEGRLDDAYGFTSETYRRSVSRADFGKTWSTPTERARHAAALVDAADSLDAAAPELSVAPLGSALQEKARQALQSFLRAAGERRFDRAYVLLALPLRARYTPERLGLDFGLESGVQERLRRARLAAERAPVLRGGRAEFRISDSTAVVLVNEEGTFRVLSLE